MTNNISYWEITKYNPPPKNHPNGFDLRKVEQSEFELQFGTTEIKKVPPIKPEDAQSIYLFIYTNKKEQNQTLGLYFNPDTKNKSIKMQELQPLLQIARDEMGIICNECKVEFGWISGRQITK